MKKNLYSPPITFAAERDEADELLFRGYASTFGNRHLNGFVFEPGAFTESIDSFRADGKVLWAHNWQRPIGTMREVEQDDKGLRVQFRLAGADGRSMAELITEKVVDKLSIGFDIGDDRFDKETRSLHILSANVFEVSPVPLPANPQAVIELARLDRLGQMLSEGAVDSKLEIFHAQDMIEELVVLLGSSKYEVEAEKVLTGLCSRVADARDEVTAKLLDAEGLFK